LCEDRPGFGPEIDLDRHKVLDNTRIAFKCSRRGLGPAREEIINNIIRNIMAVSIGRPEEVNGSQGEVGVALTDDSHAGKGRDVLRSTLRT
jgi:hypothetical protein